MKNRSILLLSLALFASAARAQTGFVGVYADSQGTIPCASVPQYTGTLLYIVATTDGPTASGFTVVEFRVEVTSPTGWLFSYIPPQGSITLGNVLDTDPASETDGSGLDIAFSSCRAPNATGKVGLGTISIFNAGGAPTNLLVKRHSRPSNSVVQCPAFGLCDTSYTMVCMSTGTAAACSLGTGKAMLAHGSSDGSVFAMGLNSELELPQVAPEGRASKPPDVIGQPTLVTTLEMPDIVNEWNQGLSSKVTQDTSWIADWSFDSPVACNGAGWTHYDNRVENNGQIYWSARTGWAHSPITGRAAVLRSFGSCWSDSGYGNNWDQSLRLAYLGNNATLSFDFMLGTEPSDGMTVEADIGCSSQNNHDPRKLPSELRNRLGSWPGGSYAEPQHITVSLPQTLNANCAYVYIRFTSDKDYSDEDGLFRSPIGAAIVVDNIVMTGGIAYTENFELQTWNPNVVPVNSAPSVSFGDWARLFKQPTDNDPCSDDLTCAWIFSDPTRAALNPSMQFGPGRTIVGNWADQIMATGREWLRGSTFTVSRPEPSLLRESSWCSSNTA